MKTPYYDDEIFIEFKTFIFHFLCNIYINKLEIGDFSDWN